MAKDPAFLFYSSDFLTGTMFMSDEQVGKYIRLLCAQHQTGRLPEKHMLKICGTRDEEIFCKFNQDESGLFYNSVLDEVIDKRKKYSESRSNNRKGKTKQPKKKDNISKSYDTHMEDEDVNEDISKTENELKIEFTIFWLDYHKTTGKPKTDKVPAFKYWGKLNKSERLKAIESIDPYSKTNESQYLKKARTYLADKSFNDQFNGQNKQNNEPVKTEVPDYSGDPIEQIEKLRDEYAEKNRGS